MNKPNLTFAQAAQDNAIRQAEMRYVGSFIAGVEPRERQFFTERQLIKSSDQFRDAFTANVYRAVEAVLQSDGDPTPEKLASALVEEKLVVGIEPDDLDKSVRVLADQMREHARYGAKTLREFQTVEALLARRIREDSAANWIKTAEAIFNKVDGRSHPEKLLEVRASLDELLGSEHVAGKSLGLDEQIKLLEETFPKEMDALVGKCLPALPPHFGPIADTIGSLGIGEMSVFAAPTGSGKSIFVGMTAEWNALAQGMHTLLVAFEDDEQVLLRRAAARWVPQTTYAELEQGDPRGALKAYAKIIRDMYAKNGGTCRYEVRPGLSGGELILYLEGRLQDAIAKGKPIQLICIDYLQKIAFWKDARLYGNETLAVQYTADRLRTLAQTYKCHVMLGSQVTKEQDGGVKIAWGKAVGDKSQLVLVGSREIAEDDLVVYRRAIENEKLSHKEGPVLATPAGSPLPYMFIRSEKANRKPHVLATLQVMGASQRLVDPSFHIRLRSNADLEWQSVRYQKATVADVERYNEMIEKQELVAAQFQSVLNQASDAKKSSKGKGKTSAYSNGNKTGYTPY